MFCEDVKIEINSTWSEEVKVRKSKKHPVGVSFVEHSDKTGLVDLGFSVDIDSLEKLVDVIQDEMFKHDGVKLNVSFNTSNW